MRYEDYARAIAGHRLPLAYVDLDALDANIAAVAARSGAKGIRIATKSVRSRALLGYIAERLPGCCGLMCYSAWEAVWLAGLGMRGLLVGYPVAQPEALAAVAGAVAAGADITLMADLPAHLHRIQAAAAAAGTVLPVCIDADMSSTWPGLHFGVRRSAVGGLGALQALVQAAGACGRVRLVGLMGYEAQIAGTPDTGPGLRPGVVRWLKGRSVPAVARRRAALCGWLQAAGIATGFVNGGGTGSLETTAREACVTEVTVGSAFFAPHLFDHYAAFKHQPAAGFALEITRQPAPGIWVCAGGGYVASGSPGPAKVPLPHLPAGCRLLAHEMAGEVQTPFRYTGTGPALALGMPVFFRHAKAGELCSHFPRLLLLRQGNLVGEAATYAGEGQWWG